jgi:hypothetical protein
LQLSSWWCPWKPKSKLDSERLAEIYDEE